jgi:hypothetical protein
MNLRPIWAYIATPASKQTNKQKTKLCSEAHTCTPSYSGGGDRKDHSLRPTGKKLAAIPPSQPVQWVWWYAALSPATKEAEVGGSWYKASYGQKTKTKPGDPI